MAARDSNRSGRIAPPCGAGGRGASRLCSTATAVIGSALLAGCSAPAGLGRSLGDDLGTFSVDALETANACGRGAVGSMPRLQFDVDLVRADTELFWDGRVGGTIDATLDFDLAASVTVELRAARGVDPGCSVDRQDYISGVLLDDTSGAVTAFDAEMHFDFSASQGSACTLEDTRAAALERLPCSLGYALQGRRTRAPEP